MKISTNTQTLFDKMSVIFLALCILQKEEFYIPQTRICCCSNCNRSSNIVDVYTDIFTLTEAISTGERQGMNSILEVLENTDYIYLSKIKISHSDPSHSYCQVPAKFIN